MCGTFNEVMELELQGAGATAYSELSRQILQRMRGEESQAQLSERLGYSYNQVGKWESGHTHFSWQDFVHLCQVQGIDWQASLRGIFLICTDVDLNKTGIVQVLRDFYGLMDLVELAKCMNKSLSSARRLLTSQVKVDFADVLNLLDRRPLLLLSWLETFLAVEDLPLLQAKIQHRRQVHQGLLQFPWAPEVNAALQLEGYRELSSHSSEWICKVTRLSPRHVDIALRELEHSGLILKRGDKYLSLLRDMSFMRVPNFRRVSEHLNQRIANSFKSQAANTPDPSNPSISSTRIYPLSSEAAQRLAKAMVAFHNQVGEILKSDTGPKTHVRLLVMHSVDTQKLAEVSENELSSPGQPKTCIEKK